jgi:hypothetical protein
MRVKTALRLRSQPARSLCHAPASINASSTFIVLTTKVSLPDTMNHADCDTGRRSISSPQQGASTLLLALFVVAMLVTAIVAVLLGHKLGYQSGYYSQDSENKQAAVTSKQATTELKDLRISNKVLTNQVTTAKQELTISLANLDELRQSQRDLQVDSRQVAQLNELYADFISEKGGLPLQVLGAKIEPLPENAFEYGFDVGMLSKEGRAKSLSATLTLQNGDDFIEVPLEPARFSIQGIVRIRGRFVMPSGFKPLQVKLNLTAGDEEVEQLYDWTIGDMVDNMPLSLLDLPEVDQSPIGSETPFANSKKSAQ